MNRPRRPSLSARTGPAQAPIKRQIAAPENQVTSANATPKNPNWCSLRVTTSGIHTAAASAKAVTARLVMTPVGINTRARTSPSSSHQAVNVHTPAVIVSESSTNTATPSPPSKRDRRAPWSAVDTMITASQVTPCQYTSIPLRRGRRQART